MNWYALRSKRNGRWISGTDFRGVKPRQILSSVYYPPKLFNAVQLLSEIKHRGINLKYYEIVVVRVTEATDELPTGIQKAISGGQ